jgi:4-hydroxybenzoate polyprenyltransferase
LHPPSIATPDSASPLPLVVDLDGTLIRTDMLHESCVQLFRNAPLDVCRLPWWLRQGKAALKQQVARRTPFDAAVLPYNEQFLQWLHQQRQAGRRLVLCTASDRSQADAVARHCGLFDEVIASDGTVNLDGRNKAQALVRRFGAGRFDYAGNSAVDLHVWRKARQAIMVGASASVVERASAACTAEKVFPARRTDWKTWSRALRVHHWLKNLLLFAPLFAAHRLADLASWTNLLWAFAAFSLCASSVYVANDLMDLESDRRHPRKRERAFAAGDVSIWVGVVLVPVLSLASVALASIVGTALLSWLGAYWMLTWLYTWWLKRLALVDCLTLAGLYTLRVVAGAAAAGLDMSSWLLAFSAFLFLSLAFLKRYAELRTQQAAGNSSAHGRGYLTSDAPLIQTMGVVSGYTSAVVLSLYLNSEAVLRLYRTPELIWGAVVVLVYWVSWIWLRASRGQVHDDPLVFAIKDKASLIAGLIFALVLMVGSAGLRW